MDVSAKGSWRVTAIHHIAFAHPSGGGPTDDTLAAFGHRRTHTERGDGFLERMYATPGGYLQTLEVTGPGTVQRFVERRGAALHHLAFEVDDIDAALAALTQAGFQLIDDRARRGGMATRIAFVHPSALGGLLLELVEASDGSASHAAEGRTL